VVNVPWLPKHQPLHILLGIAENAPERHMTSALHELLKKWDPSHFMQVYSSRIVPGDREAILAGLTATQKRLQAAFSELQNGKQMQPRKNLGMPGSLQYQRPMTYHEQLLAPAPAAHKYS
jgi:hypothetical protein